jgi:hypothetical protein
MNEGQSRREKDNNTGSHRCRPEKETPVWDTLAASETIAFGFYSHVIQVHQRTARAGSWPRDQATAPETRRIVGTAVCPPGSVS